MQDWNPDLLLAYTQFRGYVIYKTLIQKDSEQDSGELDILNI
jgi:hypothetical protein